MSNIKEALKDKRYSALINNYQSGNFVKAKSLVELLLVEYPNSPELVEIKNSLDLKSKHLRSSKSQSNKFTTKQIIIWLGIVFGVAFIIWLGIFGNQRYQDLLTSTIEEQELSLLLEQTNDLISTNIGNVEQLINSGRYSEALVLLEEVEDIITDDLEFQQLKKRANDGILLISLYDEAISLGEQWEYNAGLEQLWIINDLDPDFRDIQILIEDYEQEIDLQNYLSLAENAYEDNDWLSAIEYYQNYLLDAENNEKVEEKQKLYNSYMNRINDNLSEETLNTEVIEESEDLLSKARALYLHNSIEYSFEDNRRIQDLLIAKFTTLAEQSLADAPQSISAIRASEYYYSKALQLQPYSEELLNSYLLINSFLTGYSDFNNGRWNDAETNLIFVYENDPDFAGGLIEVLLYETYTVIAKLYEEIDYFVSANNNYERAAVIAYNNPDNKLRIYEVSVNLARMRAKFGDFRASSLLFQEAISDSGLYSLSQFYGGEYGENIGIAFDNTDIGYYYTAYQYFIEAIKEIPEFIDQDLIWLMDDNNLANLCLEHFSTFSFVFNINDLNYEMLPLVSGAGIIIPSLP